ncbi:hypothetical protein CKALI_10120 [Corynebacterium kalinowskii]|uniref:Uncharacterized protein n=1 Tax=Corynebacterium kalinowskii TaxID=2675216 RepID=A0A6B8VIN6_9CORY|nr:hypothetical protein [Corynebacterium kalinowskii]QGU02879.1 hypothetical protein CKALI_10120 [Corynebacterium kalinowskii]
MIEFVTVALKYWLIPAIAIGALPAVLQATKHKGHGAFYVGATLIPVLVALAGYLLAIADVISIVVLICAVVLVAAAWIIVRSRPRTFDPFLGVLCTVNGLCALLLGTTLWQRPSPDEYQFAGIEYLMVWSWVGLPLGVIVLLSVLFSGRWHSEAAHETPDSAHARPAAEQ